MVLRRSSASLAALCAVVLTTGACNLNISTGAEARDQWTRSYPISATGSLTIRTGNGIINVEAGDRATIEVTAERIAKASTDEAAKEQLALFEIKEDVTADRVVIDSAPQGGITINVSRRVNYTVRVPAGINVTLESSNGEIVARGIAGAFSASSSNGRIRGEGLRGSIKASTTNGVIELGLDAVGPDGIKAETTNGMITVDLPANANADLSARVTNGEISHDGLNVTVIESSRRRLDGRVGTGGPLLSLETTNGAVRVRGK
jgi:DUF4097 and DUF4098 domain-containing protein YvlB